MKNLLCAAIFPFLVACESPTKEPEVLPEPPRQSVEVDVLASACAKETHGNRGAPPKAFLLGIVNVFKESAACEPMDSFGPAKKDALTYYNLAPSQPNLYAFLVGLALRESSGKYCEGRDLSAKNITAETAESGMFQFSYNSISADYGTAAQSRLRKLYAHYSAKPSECHEEFKEGIKCKQSDSTIYGSGEGARFQRLARSCPAFAVRYTAVLARVLKDHFGPIVRKEVEVKKSCVALFSAVQSATCIR